VTYFSDVSSEFLVGAGMMKVVHFSRERGRYFCTTSAQTLGQWARPTLPIGLFLEKAADIDRSFLDLVSDLAGRTFLPVQ
jgi:hypothetical protein